jgi:tRNA(adenine34) deaminase
MNKYMQIALTQAQKALSQNEVPVGAVLVRNGEIIAAAHNTSEQENSPLMHAEISLISQATKTLNRPDLADCDRYVTLEPCLMCGGAILNARVRRLYFGAYSDFGAFSYYEIDRKPNFSLELYGGICQEECSNLIKAFFNQLRK